MAIKRIENRMSGKTVRDAINDNFYAVDTMTRGSNDAMRKMYELSAASADTAAQYAKEVSEQIWQLEHSGSEYADLVAKVSSNAANIKTDEARIEKLEDRLTVGLFGSKLIESSDATTLERANGCISVLYLTISPSVGHRYVLSYLYHWGDGKNFKAKISDYDEENGTETDVIPEFAFNGDELAEIKNDGVTVGKIFASTGGYTGIVRNIGQGLRRMPYLTNECYRISQNGMMSNTIDDIYAEIENTNEDLVSFENKISATLIETKGTEASDVVKCAAANEEIRALYLSVKPASGHRFVLNYLYLQSSDNKWFVTIVDYNVSAGTSTYVTKMCKCEDNELSDLKDTSGNVIGCACFDSSKYTVISDKGEGLARLPYLSDACYDKSCQLELLKLSFDGLDDAVSGNTESISEIKEAMSPTLFLSDGTEASDVVKCVNANAMIRSLWYKNRPAAGHRIVFSYLYRQSSDNTFYFSMDDLNVSDGTSVSLFNNKFIATDALTEIVAANGETVGYIYIDSSKYVILRDQGEGLARLPYLSDACYDASRQSAVTNQLLNDRIDALELGGNYHVLTCWGDSITWGAGATANDKFYVKVLGTMLSTSGYNCTVKNCGVGGDNMSSILVRNGGAGMYLTKDIVIPASKDSSVTVETIVNYTQQEKCIKSTDGTGEPVTLMKQGDEGRGDSSKQNRTVNPMLINGVKCMWNWVSTDGLKAGYYTLSVQESQGSALTVRSGTYMYPHGNQTRGDIVILAMGTNGGFGGSADEYIRLVDLAIEASDTKKYIVCSPYGGTAWTQCGGLAGMQAVETACMKRYGARYFNWRSFMNRDAMMLEGLNATSEDNAAILEGKCPPSLLRDEVHPNDYGHHAIAKRLYEMIVGLGYV